MFKQLKIIILSLCLSTGVIASTLPQSREASIVEYTSSSEVLVDSVGIYYSNEKSKRRRKKDVKKYGKEKAIFDAKKSAVYYLLYNGTDPLLSNSDELDRFNAIQDDFFTQDIINEAITYVSPQESRVLKLDKGQGIKVYIKMKVNLAYIRLVLEENKVVFSRQELSEELGYPQIMVIPAATEDKTPLKLLKESKTDQHGAGVIESYLTSRQYDVIVPTQLETINELVSSIQDLKNVKKDPIYKLALSIGADIYIEYAIGESQSAYDTNQIAVTLKAYETTTARLLATETGYSKPRLGETFVSIEEAMLGALTNITERILNYWEDDLSKGIQYKVITTVELQNISEDKLEDVQDDLFDIFDSISNYVKENHVSDTTMDVSLWVNNETISDSRGLYRELKNQFSQRQFALKLRRVNRNRKLLILDIR